MGYIAAVPRLHFLAIVVVVLAGLGTAACFDDPPAEPDPCPVGARRAADDDACVFPWDAQCAGVVGCLPASPYRCSDASESPPRYACEECGCSGGDACVEVGFTDDLQQVHQCLSGAVREGERSDERIDDGLQTDDGYVDLYRRILAAPAALTLDELVARARERRDADVIRKDTLVIGSDEDDTGDLLAPFFDGSFGDVGDADGCSGVGGNNLTNAGRVAVSARDRADDAGCLFPGVFARCEFPSTAGCATAVGRLPDSLLLLGPQAILDADNALLRKATRANREQWLVRIENQLALFSTVFRPVQGDRFDVDPGDAGGFRGQLMFLVDEGRDDLVFGLALPEVVSAAQLRTFRLMWVDATTQQFLTAHDITPDECTFVVLDVAAGEPVDRVDVDCAKNGARVVGPVFLRADDISGLSRTAP